MCTPGYDQLRRVACTVGEDSQELFEASQSLKPNCEPVRQELLDRLREVHGRLTEERGSMLRRTDHGPVNHFALARSIAGRTLLTTGVFVVDGLMIDTGPVNARPEVERILETIPVDQVVLTHHHEDHSGNAAFLADKLGKRPWVHALGLAKLASPPPLPLYRRVTWGKPEPCEAQELGKVVTTERFRFEVIHTPGHSEDHVVLFEAAQRWLFVGDLYIANRLKVVRRDEDISAVIAALRDLMRRPDCTLFCQHSGVYPSHQQRLGAKLDFLLGVQEKAMVGHDEGKSVREITRDLSLGIRSWKWVSLGEYSGENLVRALLRDAGINV